MGAYLPYKYTIYDYFAPPVAQSLGGRVQAGVARDWRYQYSVAPGEALTYCISNLRRNKPLFAPGFCRESLGIPKNS